MLYKLVRSWITTGSCAVEFFQTASSFFGAFGAVEIPTASLFYLLAVLASFLSSWDPARFFFVELHYVSLQYYFYLSTLISYRCRICSQKLCPHPSRTSNYFVSTTPGQSALKWPTIPYCQNGIRSEVCCRTTCRSLLDSLSKEGHWRTRWTETW